MTTKDPEFRYAVFTPQEASAAAVESVRRVEQLKGRGIRFPIDMIGEYVAPLLPGQLCVILAQTSNYKSSLVRWWERHAAGQLTTERRDDECIIHVSTEELVEEQVLVDLARESGERVGDMARGEVQDWTKLHKAAIRVGQIPIFRVGDSLARPEDTPDLYLSNMLRAIRSLVDGEVTGRTITPALMVFDYLQAFPLDPDMRQTEARSQRRLQVRNDIYRLRQAAARFACPVIVLVQAKQILGGAPSSNFQMPGIYDGEERSSIAQRADRMIGLWMPVRTHLLGESVMHKSMEFKVRDDLLWMRVLKQRGSLPAGETWPLQIDHAKNELRMMDITEVDLNSDPAPVKELPF